MICAHLKRHTTGDSGTFGELHIPGVGPRGLRLQTGECPWRDNKPYVSCIPTGLYQCQWRDSPRFGWTYQVMDVPDRTHIILHIGNWCGDVDRGLRSDVKGCILLGMGSGPLDGQDAVLNSGVALTKLYAATKGEMLSIKITETWDNPKAQTELGGESNENVEADYGDGADGSHDGVCNDYDRRDCRGWF